MTKAFLGSFGEIGQPYTYTHPTEKQCSWEPTATGLKYYIGTTTLASTIGPLDFKPVFLLGFDGGTIGIGIYGSSTFALIKEGSGSLTDATITWYSDSVSISNSYSSTMTLKYIIIGE